ncbi:MAG: M28 family metallopeptidase [Bryobacteraceae bacterium]
MVASWLSAAELGDAGKRWWAHVVWLADDRLEGRATASAGHRKAAEYVAAEFERAGLKPLSGSGYLQPVRLRARRLAEERSSLTLIRSGGRRVPLTLGEHAIISLRADPPRRLRAPLVFAGYGLSMPEARYDDFAGLDLRGKIAVYISGGPPEVSGSVLAHYQSADERGKALARAGAVGAISIANPGTSDLPWARVSGNRLAPSMSLREGASRERRLSVTFNPARAVMLFEGAPQQFPELLALANERKPLPRFPLPASLEATAAVERSEELSENVAGVLPGSDAALSKQAVVISAHLDHLGRGRAIGGDDIYNGAMDNASGAASLIEIAASMHLDRKPLRRSVVFVAVTAEEKGLLGSQYFAQQSGTSLIACLNLDMFLPLFALRRLTVMGLEESGLGDRVRAVAAPLGVEVEPDPEPRRNRFIRSDQYSFIRRGIPSLAFKLGYEKGSPEEATARRWIAERYHAPSDDTAQPVDLEAAARFNHLIRLLVEDVANNPRTPEWSRESFFRRFASSSPR